MSRFIAPRVIGSSSAVHGSKSFAQRDAEAERIRRPGN